MRSGTQFFAALACILIGGVLLDSGCAKRQADSPGLPGDGTYVARGRMGFAGRLTVIIENGRIASITPDDLGHDEDFETEVEAILARVLEVQQARVDAYTGATPYTKAIIRTVEDALRNPPQE